MRSHAASTDSADRFTTYRLLTETAGQDVEAKDPLATFLVQVTRSPLVAKVEADPGV